MIARALTITGRVQGVFFRATTQAEARALGVAGWVRNCSDGSVDAHLEGAEGQVEALIERLRTGPPDARVESVEVEDVPPQECDGFEIRR